MKTVWVGSQDERGGGTGLGSQDPGLFFDTLEPVSRSRETRRRKCRYFAITLLVYSITDNSRTPLPPYIIQIPLLSNRETRHGNKDGGFPRENTPPSLTFRTDLLLGRVSK